MVWKTHAHTHTYTYFHFTVVQKFMCVSVGQIFCMIYALAQANYKSQSVPPSVLSPHPLVVPRLRPRTSSHRSFRSSCRAPPHRRSLFVRDPLLVPAFSRPRVCVFTGRVLSQLFALTWPASVVSSHAKFYATRRTGIATPRVYCCDVGAQTRRQE